MPIYQKGLMSKPNKVHVAFGNLAELGIGEPSVKRVEPKDGVQAGKLDVCIERTPVDHVPFLLPGAKVH